MHCWGEVELDYPGCRLADVAGRSMPHMGDGGEVGVGEAGGAAREQETGACACGLDGLTEWIRRAGFGQTATAVAGMKRRDLVLWWVGGECPKSGRRANSLYEWVSGQKRRIS